VILLADKFISVNSFSIRIARTFYFPATDLTKKKGVVYTSSVEERKDWDVDETLLGGGEGEEVKIIVLAIRQIKN